MYKRQHLAHDYLASDGTVLWDSSAMANYHHDVTGIGVDSATCLDQKQSINGSSDAIVTMGLGSIATDNASNGNTFAADKSFMLWGNNNGATECTNYSGTNASQRWQRVWKIAETNTVGTVEISIPAWYGVSYLLVNNSSNTFGAGTMEIALTSDGNGNMTASHDFADGAFFTFGSGAKPGGVGQNLSLWLKPDGDITVSGTDVTAWNDETGTNNFTVIDTPQYGTAADINFQQIVDFDGTNDRMDGDATITAREVFFVGRPSGVSLVMGPQVSNAGGNVNYFGYVCGLSLIHI